MTTTPTDAELELALAQKYEKLRKPCSGVVTATTNVGVPVAADGMHTVWRYSPCPECQGHGWVPDVALEKLLIEAATFSSIHLGHQGDDYGHRLDSWGCTLSTGITGKEPTGLGPDPRTALMRALWAALAFYADENSWKDRGGEPEAQSDRGNLACKALASTSTPAPESSGQSDPTAQRIATTPDGRGSSQDAKEEHAA